MEKQIQAIARMFFRGLVVVMLILNWNHDAVWAFPLGLLVGICTEAKHLTNNHH